MVPQCTAGSTTDTSIGQIIDLHQSKELYFDFSHDFGLRICRSHGRHNTCKASGCECRIS